MIPTLAELLKTQDNRATADPLFIVQEKVRDWGYSSEYAELYVWIHNETGREANEEIVAKLELGVPVYDDGYYVKYYYKERWEFVTACLTEVGCQYYIDANRHNLNEPRVYVASGYRNQEWIALRAYFLAL